MKIKLLIVISLMLVTIPVQDSLEIDDRANYLNFSSSEQEFGYSNPDWNYILINATGAKKITNGSRNVIVAILDTGADLRIPEIKEKMWINPNEIPNNEIDDDGNGYIDDVNGWNFIDENNDLNDIVGHGTFIASLFSGVSSSTSGEEELITEGLAPNISLMPLKIIRSNDNDSESFTIGDFVKAVKYAVSNSVNIISLSLTWRSPPIEVVEIFRWAYNHGVLIVSVTGNDGEFVEGISELSRLPEIMAIGAINQSGLKTEFSQYGKEIDIVAPGDNVFGSIFLNGAFRAVLKVNNSNFEGLPLEFSGGGIVTGEIVYAGLGKPENFENINATGKLVLIDRGETFFRDKVANATFNGAIGVIIANNNQGIFFGTLINQVNIPVVAITLQDGNRIKTILSSTSERVKIGELRVTEANITYLSGTSFAAPHVSATAALMLSVNPELNNTWLRLILRRTATDIGSIGFDHQTGYGLLNAAYAVEAALDNNVPKVEIQSNNQNELQFEISDDNSLYRIDFGYKNNKGFIIRSTKIFTSKTLNYTYKVNFNDNLENNDYYIAIEDISGNKEVIIEGNITYSSPNYAFVFQEPVNINTIQWNMEFMLIGFIVLTIFFVSKRNKK